MPQQDDIDLPPDQPFSAAAVAIVMLIIVCVLWGFSFPVMQMAGRAFDHAVGRAHQLDPYALPIKAQLAMPAILNAVRFAIAGGVYWLMTRWNCPPATMADIRGGLTVGAAYGAGMFFQVLGLKYLLPSVSAFLTALAVVFAPLAQALVLRQRVGTTTWAAVVLAVGGIFILSGVTDSRAGATGLMHSPPMRGFGEMVTVVASLFFTMQILAVDHWGATANTARLTALMLFTCSAVNGVSGLVLGGREIVRVDIAWLLLRDWTFLWCMAGLVIFSSVMAFHIMNRYQPWISAAMASVVYCLEPVFGTLWSVLFRTEALTWRTISGGAVILLGVLVVAVPLWKRR